MMEFRREGLEEGISIGLTQGLERGTYETKLKNSEKASCSGGFSCGNCRFAEPFRFSGTGTKNS